MTDKTPTTDIQISGVRLRGKQPQLTDLRFDKIRLVEDQSLDDIPKHYTDGSQGRARCAVCDWTGLELDVEPVDWMTEDAICPECGIDAVYLEDPEESNV